MTKRIPIIDSNTFFIAVVSVFIIAMAFITCESVGKDLKVVLFGVEQVLQKRSPYDNPTDPNRPLFHYAPGFVILQYPFLLKVKMVISFFLILALILPQYCIYYTWNWIFVQKPRFLDWPKS